MVQKRKMYHEVVKPTKDPKEDNFFAHIVYRVFYVRCCCTARRTYGTPNYSVEHSHIGTYSRFAQLRSTLTSRIPETTYFTQYLHH